MRKINIIPSDGDTVVFVPAEFAEDFKTAIKRAMATWQNPPQSMIVFQDELLGQAHIMAATYKGDSNG